MRLTGWILLAGVATSAFADAPLDLDSIAGVYKHDFTNGDIQGDTYRSEDILEIVALSPERAYVRVHLEFFNGHECGIYGIAEREGNALVYHDSQKDVYGHLCVLKIVKTDKAIVFKEDDTDWPCKNQYCGARGAFDGTSFDISARRPIRYMTRLLSSEEYSDAINEYKTAHNGRAP